MSHYDEDEVQLDRYHYDSELSTPRSEGFDYKPEGVVSAGASGSTSPTNSATSGSGITPYDEELERQELEAEAAARDRESGTRESFTERFKRYIKRILPGGGKPQASPPPAQERKESHARKQFRIPLDRYGRARSQRSSSSPNYDYDEQYDYEEEDEQGEDDVKRRPRHSNFHTLGGSDSRRTSSHQSPYTESGQVNYEYEGEEVYSPYVEDDDESEGGSSLHSGHVRHHHVRSGVARHENGPHVSAQSEEDEREEEDADDEAGLEEDDLSGVTDDETYLTDGPLSPRSRSTSRSGRSSSSSSSTASGGNRSSRSGRSSSSSRSRSGRSGRSASSGSQRTSVRSVSSSSRGSRSTGRSRISGRSARRGSRASSSSSRHSSRRARSRQRSR